VRAKTGLLQLPKRGAKKRVGWSQVKANAGGKYGLVSNNGRRDLKVENRRKFDSATCKGRNKGGRKRDHDELRGDSGGGGGVGKGAAGKERRKECYLRAMSVHSIKTKSLLAKRD